MPSPAVWLAERVKQHDLAHFKHLTTLNTCSYLVCRQQLAHELLLPPACLWHVDLIEAHTWLAEAVRAGVIPRSDDHHLLDAITLCCCHAVIKPLRAHIDEAHDTWDAKERRLQEPLQTADNNEAQVIHSTFQGSAQPVVHNQQQNSGPKRHQRQAKQTKPLSRTASSSHIPC